MTKFKLFDWDSKFFRSYRIGKALEHTRLVRNAVNELSSYLQHVEAEIGKPSHDYDDYGMVKNWYYQEREKHSSIMSDIGALQCYVSEKLVERYEKTYKRFFELKRPVLRKLSGARRRYY